MPRWVVVSGWAYEAALWPPFSSFPIDFFDFDTWMNLLEEQRISLLTRDETILMGWSLGAFLLYPYSFLKSVKASVLISCAQTFIKSHQNPYGILPKGIDQMILNLKQNKQNLLKTFYEKASFPNQNFDGSKKNFSRKSLTKGLDFLKTVSLDKPLSEKKIYMIQGKKDRIVFWKGAEKFAQDFGYQFLLLETSGHLIPCYDFVFLKGILQKLEHTFFR